MSAYIASKKATAAFFDVSVQALDGWVNAGCPVHERDEHGRIKSFDLAEVARWRIERRDEDGTTLEIERTRLTKAQADKTELEVKELRGDLVRVQAVVSEWQGLIASARAKLLALPSKLAARVAAPEKIAEGQDAAQSMIFEALSELASDGIPAEVRARAAAMRRAAARENHRPGDAGRGASDVAPAAEIIDKPMGRGKPRPKRGRQRRTGKVPHK